MRRDKRLIPIRVQIAIDRPIHLESLQIREFSDPQQYGLNLQVLLEDLENVPESVETVKRRPPAVTAPDLPSFVVARSQELDSLRRAVLSESVETPIGIVAMGGSAGVGKSVLALQLCHDDLVQAAFPDGVIWVEVGPEPVNLAAKLRVLGTSLGDTSRDGYETDQTAEQRVRSLIEDKAVLLVLDDVWNIRQVEPFLMRSRRLRTLFTTRVKLVALSLGTRPIAIGPFNRRQSLEVLRRGAGADHAALSEIADRLGDLPQAVSVAAAQLLSGTPPDAWLREYEGLRDLTEFEQHADPGGHLGACIEVTVKHLTEAERQFYFMLGIFPLATAIPIRLVARLWRRVRTDPRTRTRALIDNLANHCLIDVKEGSIGIHCLLRDYIREKLDTQRLEFHAALLEMYVPSGQRWVEVEDDGYLDNHLAYHLADAGRQEELLDVIMDFAWLSRRISRAGPSAVLADCQQARDDRELRFVEQAIRLSENVLATDPMQLATQLFGRLQVGMGPRIAALLEGAIARGGMWLRPKVATLNSADGALRRTVHAHADGIGTVSVSADGRVCISGSDDGLLKSWDLPSGVECRTFQGHQSGVKASKLLTTTVLSGSDDGSIRVWRLDTGEELAIYDAASVGVKALDVSSDGRWVVGGYDDGALRVWNVATGATETTLKGHTGAVGALRFDLSGGAVFSGGDDGTIRMWNPSSGEALWSSEAHARPVSDIAAVEGRVISASWDGTVKIWDLEDKSDPVVLKGHTNGVTCIAVGRDSNRIVSGSADGTLRVWDLKSRTSSELIGHTSWVRAVALTDAGDTAVSAADDGTLRVWDLSHRSASSGRVKHASWVTSLAVSDDVQLIVSASADGMVALWDASSNVQTGLLRGHDGRVTSVVLESGAGRAISGSDDHTVKVWDVASRECLWTAAEHRDAVNAVAVAARAGLVVSGSSDHTLIAWDLDSGRRRQQLSVHSAKVRAVACTEDGRTAISGAADGALILWRLEDQVAIALRRFGVGIKSIALLSGGSMAVSGADDGSLTLWDLDRVRALKSWQGHRTRVDSLATAGDSIVSASSDQTLAVWRVGRDEHLAVSEVARFTADCELYACAIVLDQSCVFAGDAAGEVHFLAIHSS